MKLSAILTLAIVMMFGVAIAEANVLTNAGFETGDLTGWSDWAAGASSVVSSPTHSGSWALDEALDSGQTDGGKLQNLWGSLTWDDPIYANVWVKTSALAGQEGYLKVEFRGSSWEDYGNLESSHATGTADWTQLSISGTVPSALSAPNLDKINVILRLAGAKTAGNIYFDDAYADTAPIPEPTSMLLLGTGLIGLLTLGRKKIR